LKIAPVAKQDEFKILVDYAVKVMNFTFFQSQLTKFIEFLIDRISIKQLLDPKGISNWKIRNCLFKCISQLSVEPDLIHFALDFQMTALLLFEIKA
jgi:hypothetical protein